MHLIPTKVWTLQTSLLDWGSNFILLWNWPIMGMNCCVGLRDLRSIFFYWWSKILVTQYQKLKEKENDKSNYRRNIWNETRKEGLLVSVDFGQPGVVHVACKLYFRKIIGRAFGRWVENLKMDVDENPETARTFPALCLSPTLLFKRWTSG